MGAEPGGRRFTLMLVPEGGGGSIRQLSFTLAQAQKAAAGLALLVALAALGLLGGGGGAADEGLAEENLRLRAALHAIEQRLDAVDQEMRRIRLHRDQLREGAQSGFGPLDADEAEIAAESGLLEEPPAEAPPTPAGHPADPLAWAEALSRRATRLLDRLDQAEEMLGGLAEDAIDAQILPGMVPAAWPLDGVVTSGFGWRRSPFTHNWKFHFGLDIAAERGTIVVAPGPGEVIYADWDSGYGRLVEIDHGNGVITRYGHNAQLFVADGDRVVAGQAISTVGMTGMTTGPHLHYEIYVQGQPVDPLEHLE